MNGRNRVGGAKTASSSLGSKDLPFRPSDGAIRLTKKQREAIAGLPGSVDYSIESTNIRDAVAAVSLGSTSRVYVIAANGKVAEF